MALPIKCKKYIYQNVILIEISKHKLTELLAYQALFASVNGAFYTHRGY